MNFTTKLAQAIHKNNSLLCLGLDPDPKLMPRGLTIVEFNREIICATRDLVCAYKPNLAFYEALGFAGMEALEETLGFISEDIPSIGDGKRGDIGNTAKAYASALFDCYNFSAVTVNPYLGFDSIEPFLQYYDRGVFILCRTSNAGATDFQSLRCEPDGLPLFEVVAKKASEWNKLGNVGLVVGATYPEELKRIRQSYPEMPLLIPGVGAQGGDLAKVVDYGVDKRRELTIINSSRQILYASSGKDFAEAARRAAMDLRDRINELLGGP